MTGSGDNPRKEGLQAALDFTKYTLAVAGAAILYLLNSDASNSLTGLTAWVLVGSLVCFAASAIAGILVLMQGASNVSNANYDLSDGWLRGPGVVSFLGLMGGFSLATVFVIARMFGPAQLEKPTRIIIEPGSTITRPATPLAKAGPQSVAPQHLR
jgi:Na+/serine symporter